MRREEFSLETRHVETAAGAETAPLPTLRLLYEGAPSELRSAFEGVDGTPLAASDLDVSLRLKDPIDAADPDGVLAVTNRLTGDFLCELNVAAETVLEFLAAAKRRGSAVEGPSKYRLRLLADGSPIRTDELDTFLVYATDGDLREAESLLPSSVEL